jgi:hypothetical protein
MVRGVIAVLAVLLVAGCSAAGFPKPPRYQPVGDAVLVSADGQVITALAAVVCGHTERLIARSYSDKVALIFENPVRNCNADDNSVPVGIPVSTQLAAPLGKRALIRVGARIGWTIPNFSERDLASVRRLPLGLRLSSDAPADATGSQGQPEIGDTRVYLSSRAIVELTQLVPSPVMKTRGYWFSTSCPSLAHWPSLSRLGNCRTVTWIAHGYHFLLGMAVARGMKLSVPRLRQIAEGVELSPGQYK